MLTFGDTERKEIKDEIMLAIEFFKKDNSDWGIGLCYSLLGRTSESNVARNYLNRALECFKKVEHYRGCCSALFKLAEIEK